MPTGKRTFGDGLQPGVLHWLITGRLPEAGEGLSLALFNFHHDWRQRRPAALEELQRIWRMHRVELELAAAPAEPWVSIALRDPDAVDDDDDDEENPEDEED